MQGIVAVLHGYAADQHIYARDGYGLGDHRGWPPQKLGSTGHGAGPGLPVEVTVMRCRSMSHASLQKNKSLLLAYKAFFSILELTKVAASQTHFGYQMYVLKIWIKSLLRVVRREVHRFLSYGLLM